MQHLHDNYNWLRGGNNKSSLKKFKYALFNPGGPIKFTCLHVNKHAEYTYIHYMGASMNCIVSWLMVAVHLLQLCENGKKVVAFFSLYFLLLTILFHSVALHSLHLIIARFFYRQKSNCQYAQCPLSPFQMSK